MRPELTREQRKQTGIARAKMFVKAHLDWLDGFPVGQSRGRVEWRLRPRVRATSANVVTIDRNTLTCAEITVGKLVRQFPVALPKLLGDVVAWQHQVQDVLERLKLAIHRGVPILTYNAAPIGMMRRRDQERVRQLAVRFPNLQEIVRVIVWSMATRGETRELFIDWLEEHASWLTRFVEIAAARGDDPLPTILLLADIARYDGREFANVCRFVLSDAELFELATSGLVETAQQYTKQLSEWAERHSPPAKPKIPLAEVGPNLVRHVHWIASQDRDVRQQATGLTKLILLPTVLEVWRNAWREFREVAHYAVREGCDRSKNCSSPEFFAMVRDVAETLNTHFENEPAPFPCAESLARVRHLAKQTSPTLNQALARFLESVPVVAANGTLDEKGWMLRLVTLNSEGRHSNDPEYERMWICYFTLAADFLNSPLDKSHRLLPWASRIRKGIKASPSYLSLSWWLHFELPQIKKWPSFFRVLQRVVVHQNYSDDQHDLLAYVVNVSADEDQAVQRFRQLLLLPSLSDFSSQQLEVALALECDEFSLIETLEFVRQQDGWDNSTCVAVVELHRALKAAGWQSLVPMRLRQNQRAELARIAMQYGVLSTRKLAPAITTFSESPTAPAWLIEFPAAIHVPLARLAAVASDAQQKAERLLAKHCRTTADIQKEIGVLEQLVQQHPNQPRLMRRLANLRGRVGRPPTIAGRTLEKLLATIDEAIRGNMLEQLATTMERELLRQVGGVLGDSLQKAAASEPHDSSLQPRHLALLRGVLVQKEPYRTFAIRLLRKEWCGILWDVELEPQNQKFLQRLTARGIRIEPWFELRTTRVTAPRDSRTITLAFETNAAEKMLMGYYFGTCLSPHDFNFFSAVVNAVDVNKRVLFARDNDGKVVGRCLLAIGDTGSLVTFRPYCQEAEFPFESLVAEFADRLASDMGTIVSHKDTVSPLLAPTWYDDGARDLGSELTKEGSPVRTILKDAAPSRELVDALAVVLRPVPLDANCLGLIVELPEIQERPALIEPLLPLIESSNQTTLATQSAAMQLADRANLSAPTARLANAVARKWLAQKNCRRVVFRCPHGDDLKILIRHAPSLALRVLRATRPHGVRDDHDETEPARRQRIADCLESLGRTTRAKKLKAR